MNSKQNSRQFALHRDELTEAARRLIRQHGGSGPPYDPFEIARALNVAVHLQYLESVEGYASCENGKFSAVIASQSTVTRQRFTLAHELGHILLMIDAKRGINVPLRRYRGGGIPDALHGDPVEEAVCNAFAAELLVPSDEVQIYLSGREVLPKDVFGIAKKYGVSMQATAKKLVRILGKDRVGFSFWKRVNKKRDWITPLWCTGLEAPNSHKLRAELECLVTEAMTSGTELTECWQMHTRKQLLRASKTNVHVTPTRGRDAALVCLKERVNSRTNTNPPSSSTESESRHCDKPVQLSLF
jgi:hypothetical protein